MSKKSRTYLSLFFHLNLKRKSSKKSLSPSLVASVVVSATFPSQQKNVCFRVCVSSSTCFGPRRSESDKGSNSRNRREKQNTVLFFLSSFPTLGGGRVLRSYSNRSSTHRAPSHPRSFLSSTAHFLRRIHKTPHRTTLSRGDHVLWPPFKPASD